VIIECLIVMIGLIWIVERLTDEILEQRRRETKTGEFEEDSEE